MAYATVDMLRQYLDQVPGPARQTLTISGATGGAVTLSYDGAQFTVGHNARASQVKAALLALAPLAADDAEIAVERPTPGTFRITFGKPIHDEADTITVVSHTLTPSGATVTVAQTNDMLLQSCLDRATSTIDEALHPVRFGSTYTTEARQVGGLGGQILYLPAHQPGSVTAVTLDGGVITWDRVTPEGHLYRLDGWLTTRPSGVEPSPFASPPGLYDRWGTAQGLRQAYLVTAAWGFGPAPDSIVELCLEIAVNIWRSRDKGLFTELIGADGTEQSIRYIGGLNRTQQATIANARRARVAPTI